MPRRPKPDLTQVEDLTPLDEPALPEEPAGPEPMDRSGRSAGRRIAVSVPGAIGGVLLVCAIAFGANLGPGGLFDGRDASAETVADAGAGDQQQGGTDGSTATSKATDDHQDGDAGQAEPEQTDKPDATDEHGDGDKAGPDKTEQPEPDKTEKPEPKETETPKATEKPVLGIELSIKEGAVLIDWSACHVDGADYYKVVRSTDPTVKWPTGENDDLVAAVEVGGTTKAWDEHAPAGRMVWYRVFCVRHTDDGYQVLAASGAESIRTPEKAEPTPKPEPSDLWIKADVDGNAVVLHWEASGGEDFSHYRILRKTDGEASVIAEIENADTTTYVDHDLDAGVEYHYLVQAKGHAGDDGFLLGATEWIGVTVE